MNIDRKRQRANLRGRAGEFAAIALLIGRAHVILARRFKTPVGEIDIVARRGKRIAFVEVKQRPTRALCEAAITADTRRRVRRAADLWLARHPRHQSLDIGFDVIFVTPWRLPVHLRDTL